MTRRTIAIVALVMSVLAAHAPAQTPVYEITMPRMYSPRVDGDLSDLAWSEVSQLNAKFVVDLAANGYARVKRPRVGYMGYDRHALYFAFIDYAPDPSKLSANEKAFHHGDDIEVYLHFNKEKPVEYVQVIVIPSGSVTVNSADKKERPVDHLQAATTKTGICWYTELAIPFAFLGVEPPEPGDVWLMNICGRQWGQKTTTGGWLSWCPTYGGFGNPKRAARVTFGD